jgi:hypothetical protein
MLKRWIRVTDLALSARNLGFFLCLGLLKVSLYEFKLLQEGCAIRTGFSFSGICFTVSIFWWAAKPLAPIFQILWFFCWDIHSLFHDLTIFRFPIPEITGSKFLKINILKRKKLFGGQPLTFQKEFFVQTISHFAQLCFIHQRSKNHPVISDVFFQYFFFLKDWFWQKCLLRQCEANFLKDKDLHGSANALQTESTKWLKR